VFPDQANVRCQQPGRGKSIMDGPGPPATSLLTVTVVPSSRAVMVNGSPGVTGTRDTHRILLEWSGAGGALSGSPNRTARMLPPRPSTCGMPLPSVLNPARAHVGREFVRTADPHPVAGRRVDAVDGAGGGGRPSGVFSTVVQPDTSNATITASRPADFMTTSPAAKPVT
jgi:hypothetical protein